MGFPGQGELLFDGFQIVLDHLVHGGAAAKDLLVARDLAQRLLVFLFQGQNFQADQLVQAHLQNRGGLPLGKMQLLCIRLKTGRLKLDIGDVPRGQASPGVL